MSSLKNIKIWLGWFLSKYGLFTMGIIFFSVILALCLFDNDGLITDDSEFIKGSMALMAIPLSFIIIFKWVGPINSITNYRIAIERIKSFQKEQGEFSKQIVEIIAETKKNRDTVKINVLLKLLKTKQELKQLKEGLELDRRKKSLSERMLEAEEIIQDLEIKIA